MLKNRLSALDASFLSLEDEDSNMCVGGADVFAGPAPEHEEVLDELGRRLDAVPNFRLRRVSVPFGLGRPRWADAEDFRLEDHITRVVLPEPGDAERVQALFARLMAQPVDHDRPPWEIQVIEGLEGGRFALLHKMHHALVDGIASVQVLETLFSADPAGGDDVEPRPLEPKPAPSPVRMLAESVVERTLAPEALGAVAGAVTHPRRTAGSVVKGAAGVAGLARAALRPAPDTPYNQPVGPERSFAWQRESLDEVKAIKDALGGSVNDVVLTAVAGALDRDLRRRGGHPGADEMFAFVPVSLRSDSGDGQLGNEVSGLKVALPLGEDDPLERFARVHQTMDALKGSPQALGASAAVGASGLVSAAAFEAMSPVGDVQRYANLVITNVPGPPDPLYFLGRELEDVFPFVPLAANLAMGVAVVSYAGTLGFGFSADPETVPDVHELAPALHESLAELADAARSAASQ
ncbi:MAG TPA: wax ester/triacylglycerol synthase family O-acyltransferase [Thermoleophilaceae bacterium]|nr:wax ester/triacylglycerol synthase family O-acyltransferase [Thermoleophilaceae bacterium]